MVRPVPAGRGGFSTAGVSDGGGAEIADTGPPLVFPGFVGGGLQHGGDLDRMVAVIVDHGHAVAFAGFGEAALDPVKRAKPLRIASAVMPISLPTAMAARLFCTLCRPCMGRWMSAMVRGSPV